MSMISVTLPDGSVNEYAAGITAGEIVIDIEGRKHDCVAALVDGEQKDFSATLDSEELKNVNYKYTLQNTFFPHMIKKIRYIICPCFPWCKQWWHCRPRHA